MKKIVFKIYPGPSVFMLLFCFLFYAQAITQGVDTMSMAVDTSRYLDQQKISGIKADRLQYLPFRSINGTALSNPNTYYLKYDRLFVDGLEATGDYVFIEGMQVGDAVDFPFRAIGAYELYRGNQPIQYGNVAGSLMEITTPVYKDKVHFDVDGYTSLNKGYKHNGVEMNAGGPIRFSGKKKAGRAAGFYIASNYSFTNDENPSSETKYMVTDETQNYLTENPLRLSGATEGSTFLNAEFLGPDDIKEVNTHQHSDRQSSNTFLKFSFPFSKNIMLTMGSYAKFEWGEEFVFDNALLNSHNNPETSYRNFDNFLNFEHQFDINEELKIGYKVNLQYSNYYFEQQDSRYKDRYFEYGYLGKYSTAKIPSYELVDEITIDGVTYENVYVLNSWDNDTAYTFQNLNYNPESSRFTEQVYELFPDNFGNWQNSTQLQLNKGLLNGQNPQMVYGEQLSWNSQGTVTPYYLNSSSGYRSMGIDFGYTQSEKYRGTLQFDVSYKSHKFFIGFEYDNEIERSYSVNPMALWGSMRSVTNNHLLQLDISNPQMDQISNSIIYYYRMYDEQAQFTFDKNLRAKLGLPVDGLDFILTDSYDMVNNTIDYYDKDGILRTISTNGDLFSLDMFSPEELLNDGNYIVNPAGYDYLGNKLKGKQGEYDFFENRTIDAYRPSYFSAFFGDRFMWKSLDISVGLRIDNFNANQPMLKDPYLLYPAKTVGEVTVVGGEQVAHPENMGEDYVVYVDNVSSPIEITGYRDGDTWYNYSGEEIQDPDELDRGSGISPYLTDPQQDRISTEVFEDYQSKTSILPQINLEFKKEWGNIYFNYNSFSQNPIGYNAFRPDQYFFINPLHGVLNNPALEPTRIDKLNIGVMPRLFKTLYADVSYTQVYVSHFNYVDEVTGAYPTNYITVNNLEGVLYYSLITAAINYYTPKSSGIAAGSSFTYNFIADANNYYLNIPKLVVNTHLTFNFGNGKEFVLGGNKTGRAIFENFGIGIFHQHRKGIELPKVYYGEQNYFQSPDIDLVNLRLEKGIHIRPLNLTASFYIWIENLLNRENLFYIDQETGKPDDDGYLSAPENQNSINNEANPNSYRMLYEYKLKNPDYYDIPRIVRAGLIVKL